MCKQQSGEKQLVVNNVPNLETSSRLREVSALAGTGTRLQGWRAGPGPVPQCTALILPRAEPPRAGLSQVSLGMNLSHLSTEAAARMPEGMALPIYLCQRKSISLSSQASSSGSIKIKKNNNKNPSSPVCCHIHRAGGVQIPPQPCSEMHRPRYPEGEDAPQAASRSFLEKLQVQPVGPRFPQKWPQKLLLHETEPK